MENRLQPKIIENNDCQIFIGAIPINIKDAELKNELEKFGELDFFKLHKNERGNSKGFAFVTFKSKKSAVSFIQTKHVLENTELDVKKVLDWNQMKLREEEERKRKIYVGALPLSIEENLLTDFFKRFGKIEKVIINRRFKDNKPRGSGFVIFKDKCSAKKVLDLSETLYLKGKKILVQESLSRWDIKKLEKNQDIPGKNYIMNDSKVIKKKRNKKRKRKRKFIKKSKNNTNKLSYKCKFYNRERLSNLQNHRSVYDNSYPIIAKKLFGDLKIENENFINEIYQNRSTFKLYYPNATIDKYNLDNYYEKFRNKSHYASWSSILMNEKNLLPSRYHTFYKHCHFCIFNYRYNNNDKWKLSNTANDYLSNFERGEYK